MADRLQEALSTLQVRFGGAAPRPLQAPPHPVRPSGIAELDELTGIGGWPVGKLSLLNGSTGSGKRTIAQLTAAQATRESAVAYIDFAAHLDPLFLSRMGAELDQLLIVRPKTVREGIDSAITLARSGADLVCLDFGPAAYLGRKALSLDSYQSLDGELPVFVHRAAEAACTVLLINDAEPVEALRYYASLIVGVQRRDWILGPEGDLAGIEVEALAVKNRLAPPGRRALLRLAYQ
jgi:recombination protein RecA